MTVDKVTISYMGIIQRFYSKIVINIQNLRFTKFTPIMKQNV